MKDTELIELYWNRDQSAITETANAYGNYCYSIAYNILNNNRIPQKGKSECNLF